VTARGVADVSLGGALVYSDDLLEVGAQISVELSMPGGAAIELWARVVRVSILRPTGPAFCAVALQFVGLPEAARSCLSAWLAAAPESRPAAQPRVREHYCEDLQDWRRAAHALIPWSA
jgi:hypothetical protein